MNAYSVNQAALGLDTFDSFERTKLITQALFPKYQSNPEFNFSSFLTQIFGASELKIDGAGFQDVSEEEWRDVGKAIGKLTLTCMK